MSVDTSQWVSTDTTCHLPILNYMLYTRRLDDFYSVEPYLILLLQDLPGPMGIRILFPTVVQSMVCSYLLPKVGTVL